MSLLLTGQSLGVDTNGVTIGVDADVNPFPLAAGSFQVSSSDANDTLAGSGCRKVRAEVIIEKTSGELVVLAEVIDMNGTTGANGFAAVPDAVGAWRVRLIRSFEVGDVDADPPAPVGTITATIGGIPVSRIKPGAGRSNQVVFSATSRQPEAITSATARIVKPGGGAPAEGQVQLWHRLPGAGWEKVGNPLFSSEERISLSLSPRFRIAQGGDLRMTVPDVAGSSFDVHASFIVETSI